jgi:hypothetical protein
MATPQEIYDAFYDQAKKAIQDSTQHQVVSSWYMPEEMRPWVANDMGAIRKAVLAIRDAETELNVAAKPIQQYQPNHSDVARLNSFKALFDIVSKGS